ncbi:MAG: hypothetical protein ACKPKO_40215 [Candidatus Fonsibacter sp.]
MISKSKPDGTVKHRLVWDLRRSGVNSLIRLGERIVLPRVQDLIDGVFDLFRHATADDGILFFGTDVLDACHHIPLNRQEQRFTATAVNGVYYVFRALVFGSASAQPFGE